MARWKREARRADRLAGGRHRGGRPVRPLLHLHQGYPRRPHHRQAALAKRGIATVRFDFTGLGSSAGEFASTDFSSNVGDPGAGRGRDARRHRRAAAPDRPFARRRRGAGGRGPDPRGARGGDHRRPGRRRPCGGKFAPADLSHIEEDA